MIKYDFLPYLSLQILDFFSKKLIFHILHNFCNTMQYCVRILICNMCYILEFYCNLPNKIQYDSLTSPWQNDQADSVSQKGLNNLDCKFSKIMAWVTFLKVYVHMQIWLYGFVFFLWLLHIE